MYEILKKIGKVCTSKFVGPGPSSYEKRLYRAAVSQRLRNKHCSMRSVADSVFSQLNKLEEGNFLICHVT
jgi:hypothetical protein